MEMGLERRTMDGETEKTLRESELSARVRARFSNVDIYVPILVSSLRKSIVSNELNHHSSHILYDLHMRIRYHA